MNITSKEEIEELFANNFVLLEGEAAYTLYEMGYGRLAGINNAIWHHEDSGFQAYEQVCNGKIYCGLKEARTSAQACAGDLLEIEYCTHPDLITVIRNPKGENAAPGMAICGNVFILPYNCRNEMHRAHLNPIKQEIVQNVLKNCRFNEQVIFTEGVPYVSTFMYNLGEKKAAVILNSSIDDTGEIKLYAPCIHSLEILELNRLNTVPVKANAIQEGEYIVLKDGLAGMDMKVLIF
jgi:hypothetical protein